MMARLHGLLAPLVLLLLLVEMALASTASSASAAEQATTPPTTPTKTIRVATLLPWVAEALALAGPEATVVAGVRRHLHEPLPAGLVDLGNPHSPSLERLAEAHPDLVVGDRAIHARLAPRLESLGGRVLLLGTDSVAETLASLATLSEALGRPKALDARIAETRAQLDRLQGKTQASVVALFGAPGSFFVMTERAWLGDLARHVGYRLAIDATGEEQFPGLVAVSDEAMAMAHPDLVLLVAHGDPRKIQADLERRTASDGAWAGLAKTRLGIHVLDPQLFSANPGLEIVRAAEALVALAASGPAR
jgi:iron complex transport system substrate-binding protein